MIAWCGVVLVLGALAPFADRALSGAGWEALGSESVAARHALEADFPGRGTYALSVVVAGPRGHATRRAATLARVRAVLRSDAAVSGVLAPRAGHAGSRHGGRRRAGGSVAGRDGEGGRPAEGPPRATVGRGVTVRLTGAAAMWSDFNAANKAAMLKSEVLSWPLTLVLLLFAFGTLVAAGLPLLLTMAGLLGAGGLLFVFGQFADVSIWAMNFAMMFAIALGIDYALFIVVRFRAALAEGLAPRDATAVTMATAGKAVLMSGLTVIAALLAVTLVPVPAFRSVPLGIALAVAMVLAATLTLLPAVLSRLGHRINGGRMRMRGGIDHRSERFAAWGRRLWARPLPYGAAACAILLLLAAPALGLRTGMPTAAALPRDAGSREGQRLLQQAFGDGAASALQIVVPERDAADARSALERDRGIAAVAPAGVVARPRAADRDPQRRRGSRRAAGDDRPRPRRAARRRAARGRRRRDPRPRARARLAPPARRRRGPRPRLRAAARPAAGAARRGRRRRAQPARDRRGLRRGPARVPGGSGRPAPRLGVAGVRRRVGADLLLRARLRAGDGLQRVPAGHGQGGPRPHGRRPAGARGGAGRHGAHDQRGRRGDGRGLHDVRARGPDRAQGDGRDPGRRGAAGRHADPAAAAAGRAAPARARALVDARVARPPGPEGRAVPRAARAGAR